VRRAYQGIEINNIPYETRLMTMFFLVFINNRIDSGSAGQSPCGPYPWQRSAAQIFDRFSSRENKMLSVQMRIHLGGNDRISRTRMRITHPDGQWREYCLAEGADTKLLPQDERSRQAKLLVPCRYRRTGAVIEHGAIPPADGGHLQHRMIFLQNGKIDFPPCLPARSCRCRAQA